MSRSIIRLQTRDLVSYKRRELRTWWTKWTSCGRRDFGNLEAIKWPPPARSSFSPRPLARRSGVTSGLSLVNLAQIRGENVQFGTVFGHGAARNDDAFFAEYLDDFLVGEGLLRVLLFEQVGNHVF